MFFLARSAVCIGLVVSALPDSPGRNGPTEDGSAVAAAAVGRFCRAHPASCTKAIQGALAVTLAPVVAGPAHRRISTATHVL